MRPEERVLANYNEIEKFNIEDLRVSLNHIIGCNLDLIKTLYDSKINLGEGEVYIETLIIKIIFCSNSFLELSKGTEIIGFSRYPRKIMRRTILGLICSLQGNLKYKR